MASTTEAQRKKRKADGTRDRTQLAALLHLVGEVAERTSANPRAQADSRGAWPFGPWLPGSQPVSNQSLALQRTAYSDGNRCIASSATRISARMSINEPRVVVDPGCKHWKPLKRTPIFSPSLNPGPNSSAVGVQSIPADFKLAGWMLSICTANTWTSPAAANRPRMASQSSRKASRSTVDAHKPLTALVMSNTPRDSEGDAASWALLMMLASVVRVWA